MVSRHGSSNVLRKAWAGWDLGRNDHNVIWLHQFVAGYNRFVGYCENSGEFIGHYVAWLNEWART